MKEPEGWVPEGYNWHAGAPLPSKAVLVLPPLLILPGAHVL
jgi:hypothetical protein